MDKNEEQKNKDAQEFDKVRQQADQERANAEKARKAADAARTEAEAAKAEAESLKQKLQEMEAKAGVEASVKSHLPEIDLENADIEELAKHNKAMAEFITKQQVEIAQMKSTIETEKTRINADREKSQQELAANRALNNVCNRMEKKYGAGLRNKALELMAERNEKEGRPSDPVDATLRLDECFAQVAKSDPHTRTRAISDPGGGGGRPSFDPAKIKPGSLDDVAEQFANAAPG